MDTGAPTLAPDERRISVSANHRAEIIYTYDLKNNGRLKSRLDTSLQDPAAVRAWEYDDNGFVNKTIDENGNTETVVNDERGNATARTTCRIPGTPTGTDCHTRYSAYYLNAADPLDPRNDVQLWTADGRSANASDNTYRTTRAIDAAGRVRR